ncbi:MAG: hypothetical protein HZA70_05015 [Planctomycetes bacterium]|nr:hypothetical protein [Planctomycetota bacterium]
MKQCAHAWVALRALKLLDDWGKEEEVKKVNKLVEMLSCYLADVWDGALIPDTLLVDMSYGHVFKMDSDPNYVSKNLPNEKWFIKPVKELKTYLVGKRLCLDYIKDCEELDKPYRTHLEKGGHLPSRVIALCHGVSDMLKMGDYPLAEHVKKKLPEKVKDASNTDWSAEKIKNVVGWPNFSARQIAMQFFILAHYVTDAHMPLHCDLRDFTVGKKSDRRLPEALHPLIEELWEESFPSREDLALTRYSNKSLDEIVGNLPKNSLIEVNKERSEYYLGNDVEKSRKGDEWNEMVYTARVSYAVARKWITADKDYNWWEKKIPKGKKGRMVKNALGELVHSGKGLGDGRFVEEFKDVTNRIFHDAVRSVARLWYHTWQKFVE